MSKLIRIKYYESPIEANRDKQILLENGIESFIANEQTIQSDWLLSQAIGGLQLQVFEEDVEKAKVLLMQLHGLNEEHAFQLLRKNAMSHRMTIGEMARRLLDAQQLLQNQLKD